MGPIFGEAFLNEFDCKFEIAKNSCSLLYIYIYIYIYIKWTVFVNVTTKSAQHAHARMIARLLKKVQTQVICTTMVSWIIPIVRQSVNHKKIL